MVTFKREIYPVGQGGFAFESIGSYSVVFDCGSATSPKRVSQYIVSLKQKVNGKIDRLYLSHFDKDHVNSIKELIDVIGVKEAVIPLVPQEYKVIYDIATDGAYSSIMGVLSGQETNVQLIEPQDNDVMVKDVWEWIAKPMITNDDWDQLSSQFESKGIVIGQLIDPNYVASVKDIIKRCFDSAFRKRINSKGLILLSQNIGGLIINNKMEYNGSTRNICGTAALYLGDADTKTQKRIDTIKKFLSQNLNRPLVFIQIPHHGSQNNSSPTFNQDFPASYYYFNDISCERLKKNTVLFNTLSTAGVLLEVMDVDCEMIEHTVVLQ